MTGPLVRRIFDEHRAVVVPLIAALAINIVGYALLVYPLSQRVANVAERNQAAAQALTAARADYAQAAGLVSGKSRASTELATFYTKVLPADLSAARRLTHLRLAQLARDSGVQLDHETLEPDDRREGSLARLKGTMDLVGSYPAIRRFIHQLEVSPEFVVIDNVQLSDASEGDRLQVKVELSTYYRTTAS
jgi:Tfp pilus assembly protein PilO